MFNFGTTPFPFNHNHINQQISDIQTQINNIKMTCSQCPNNFPIKIENNFGQMNSCQTKSWVPPKSDDPLVNLVVDIKYKLCNNDSCSNICSKACFDESICILFVNNTSITIECANDPTNCDGVNIIINKHPSCKQKKIIYDAGLLLRTIGLKSTRGNVNHLLEFLEDLARTSMYFKDPVIKVLCELKKIVEEI